MVLGQSLSKRGEVIAALSPGFDPMHGKRDVFLARENSLGCGNTDHAHIMDGSQAVTFSDKVVSERNVVLFDEYITRHVLAISHGHAERIANATTSDRVNVGNLVAGWNDLFQ